MVTENLALQYLEEHDECLDDYDGLCGELVDSMMHWLGEDRVEILYIKPRTELKPLELGDFRWVYHMVPVIDGLVHDAWAPHNIFEPDIYILTTFPEQILTWDFPAGKDDPEVAAGLTGH